MTMSINGTNGLTFNDASTQNTAATGFGFKNRIINGAMVIDQRNAGAQVTIPTGASTYALDRWVYAKDNATMVVKIQQGNVSNPVGFPSAQLITATTGGTIGAAEFLLLMQKIEGNNVADFGFGTASASSVTVSFWVRSSLAGTYSVALSNAAFNRSYVQTYTINSANVWEQKFITVAGDTSGTWVTDNSAGLRVIFDQGSGSSYNTTAGAWQAGTYVRTSGTVNWGATTGATFYITGVQLEKGSTATSYDYRPYGTELALCQRYYQFVGGVASGPPFMQGYSIAGQTLTYSALFPVPMRATPTTVKSGTWAVANVAQPSVDFCTAQGFSLRALASTSASGYFFPDTSDDNVTFSAEL